VNYEKKKKGSIFYETPCICYQKSMCGKYAGVFSRFVALLKAYLRTLVALVAVG